MNLENQEDRAKRIADDYTDSRTRKNEAGVLVVEWGFDREGIPSYKAFVPENGPVVFVS